jgi:hypothetical protein
VDRRPLRQGCGGPRAGGSTPLGGHREQERSEAGGSRGPERLHAHFRRNAQTHEEQRVASGIQDDGSDGIMSDEADDHRQDRCRQGHNNRLRHPCHTKVLPHFVVIGLPYGFRQLAHEEYRAAMADLVEALSLAALTAATLEYAILVRHRVERREALHWQAEVRESLVSIGRGDTRAVRQWTDDGTRFRPSR